MENKRSQFRAGALLFSVVIFLAGCQAYPPQFGSMPSAASGSSSCGNHCGWLNFQNGGIGFDPATGTTKGKIKLRVGAANAPHFNTSHYNVKWFGDTAEGCASNISSTEKQFNSNSNEIYDFTVYFVPGNCPVQGTSVYFEVSFVP